MAVTEFEKLRRQRRLKKRLRAALTGTAVLLAGLVVLLVTAVVYQLDLATQVQNAVASFKSGGSFPVSMRDYKVRDLLPIGRDVAVVTQSGVMIYNSRGTLLAARVNEYTQPVIRIAGGKILTYDLGGTGIRVDNKTEALYSGIAHGRIYAGDIAPSGHLAVATAEAGYLARVTVLSPKFEERYNWYTGECYVTDLKLSQKGNMFCAAGISGGEGGWLVSHLRFHHTDNAAEAAAVLLRDELILSMEWTDSDNLQVVTDHHVYLFDKNGKELAKEQLPGKITHLINLPSGGLFLAHGDHRSAGGAVVDAYDSDLKKVGSFSTDREILSLKEGGGRLVILTEGRLFLGDRALGQVQQRRDTDLYYVCYSGNNIYGITPEGLIREAL